MKNPVNRQGSSFEFLVVDIDHVTQSIYYLIVLIIVLNQCKVNIYDVTISLKIVSIPRTRVMSICLLPITCIFSSLL